MIAKTKNKAVIRPWGQYLVLEKSPNHWLKKIFVRRGEKLSLQKHNHRSEIWVVLKGKIKAIKDKKQITLGPSDVIKINKKEEHRIIGLVDSWILEIAFGQVRETDIIRLADDYGRIEKKKKNKP